MIDITIFVIVTLVAIVSSLYLYGLSQVDFLKKNWIEYRCNPIYMPMAGLVGQDVATNFTQCTMKGFHDYAGFIMDPLIGQFTVVNETLGEIGGAMNSMREMSADVRNGFMGIIGSVFGKIQNLMSQFQYIIIRMRTLMGRIVGVMAGFVYMFHGGMQTATSIQNGPIMKTMSFLCFSSDTLIHMKNHKFKPIQDITVGSMLANNNMVVSTYILNGEGVQMFDLSGVIVSGTHKVFYDGNDICVKDHPDAYEVGPVKTLYCLNTVTGIIPTVIDNFLDFRETSNIDVLRDKRKYVEQLYNGVIDKKNEVTSLVTGLAYDTPIPLKDSTKQMGDIVVGDVLDNGEIVRGIARHLVDSKLYSSIDGIVMTPSTWVLINGVINTAQTYQSSGYTEPREHYMVHQLITESSTYPALSKTGRIMIIDELETTDECSGSFPSKRIV